MQMRSIVCWPTALAISVAVLGIVVEGCGTTGQTTWFRNKQEPTAEAERASAEKDPREESAAVQDTIATVAWLEGMRRMSVGGYGLVVGLGKNGTSQCPRPIREYMLQDMRRRYRLGAEADQFEHLAPENLLDSEETAVVIVYGEIPAAAERGETFDLTVRTIERTDATSLEGGWLMPCSLKLWSDGQPVEGRIMGEATGQVFINPFGLREEAATKADPRTGRVIGGGTVTKPRRIRLVLTNPSAAIAGRLMQLINRRFGVEPHKTADARDPHVVDLHVPAAWRESTPHFLRLLMHLYVPAAPSFRDSRLRDLCEEAVEPGAPLADISLAWEGMGKTVLPAIRKLYTHKNDAVSFFSARAGLRLDDSLALDVMARHANTSRNSFRELAIQELGLADDRSRVTAALLPLLDDNDQRIRQLAYEGLRNQGAAVIRSIRVGEKGGFVVDEVQAGGKFLVSARRTKEQRITLFGAGMRCQPPVFYWHRHEIAIITANEGDKQLKLVRRTPISGRLSTPVYCKTDVASLITALGSEPKKDAHGHYRGLGLTYSQVVEVLHDLCADKAIEATFVLQTDGAPEILPMPEDAGRPESEL